MASDDTPLRDLLRGKRFGLALSAGFFGFYGHAGFLAGLLEDGLAPSAYAGSSAGGLVGALAAAGMAPAQIISLLLDLKRGDFWDPDLAGALWSAVRGHHGSSGLLRGHHFQRLLEAHLPVRDIEDCPTPLLLVATSLSDHRLEVFRRGPLAPRIHATCAYPGLFRAVEIDGGLYWDGGLVDKAPALALADAAAPPLDAVLVHYLPSHRRAALGGALAYVQGLDAAMTIARRDHFALQLQVLRARGIPAYVVVSELPRVSPSHLARGAEAVVAARAAIASALAAPPVPFEA